MIAAFLSDIHGNSIAFEACLLEMGRLGVEKYFFLGDAVGYLPDEHRVLERLASIGAICQQGNHEAMLLSGELPDEQKERSYQLAAVRGRLEHSGWLRTISQWPKSREVTIGARKILLVHGSPSESLFDYVYPDTDLRRFGSIPHDMVVMGNTHIPFARTEGSVDFVNTGSIGLPRDRGDLASFGVFDSKSESMGIIRVPIDTEAIVETYGALLSESVRACFQRATSPMIGKAAL